MMLQDEGLPQQPFGPDPEAVPSSVEGVTSATAAHTPRPVTYRHDACYKSLHQTA